MVVISVQKTMNIDKIYQYRGKYMRKVNRIKSLWLLRTTRHYMADKTRQFKSSEAKGLKFNLRFSISAYFRHLRSH